MEHVDIALILALDGSASVTYEEFGLIARGCAAAFRDPDVIAGLLHGPAGASLCALVLWSGHEAQKTLIDWTRLADAAAVAAFAQAVEDVPRIVRAGGTAIGEALAYCERLLQAQPAPAGRRLVDVAGDGRSNEGERPETVRDRLVAAGVTINGLCVLHEEPDLLESYRREVIGGPGAFALQCQDYDGFARAIREKLVEETA
ncbi:MAG: DUF1194 domain-containing protein [Acetobacteraceae bacterium]|nr:DUF1194 domain-containing protein [Acetobacteraceae bacterium]